jgi:tetraacyldisaccharide 4'-kinase
MPFLPKTPKFWHSDATITSALLKPASMLYQRLSRKRATRAMKYPQLVYQSKIPVICVGNATIGGSGKTPYVLHLADEYSKAGNKVAVICRGYGGTLSRDNFATPVIHTSHNAKDVGDEAMLISQYFPTFIAKQRERAVELIEFSKQYDIIILDDGWQYPYLQKSKIFNVIDGKYGFGNHKIFPQGPLRITIATAIKQADQHIIIGRVENEKLAKLLRNIPQDKVMHYDKHITIADINGKTPAKTTPLMAFAAIAHPNKFYDSLRNCGYNLVNNRNFADHYHYNDFTIAKLLVEAEKIGAKLITTEKDYVKIPAKFKPEIMLCKLQLVKRVITHS